MPSPCTTRRCHGFTLIELLVVIIIIGVVVAVSFPVLNRLTDIGQGDAGVTTVSAAVNAARILNHRLNPHDVGPAGPPFADYTLRHHGTAVIFTQGGEIRLTETDQRARDDQNPAQPLQTFDDLLVGFRDIVGTDYISLPRRTGIVGVVRRNPNEADRFGGLRFIPPPFAIRFDRQGQLTTHEEFVYYNFHDDGAYRVFSYPAEAYNPDDHDPRRGENLALTNDGRYIYPIEQIPVVKAVILFDAHAFRTDWGWEALDTDIDNDPELRAWFEDHGRTVYFSPQTGVALRGETR